MKTALFAAGIALCLLAGFVITEQGDATAERAIVQAPSDIATVAEPAIEKAPSHDSETCQTEAASPVFDSTVGEPLGKKCSFNSDCSHGKCKSGKCGGCSFNSDCKGWGKCGKGQCGSCSFDSECKGFGKCSKGKCTKSPYKK